jgi:hypothetical protein
VVFLFAFLMARAPAFRLGPTSHLVPFGVIPFAEAGMLWISLVLGKKTVDPNEPVGPARDSADFFVHCRLQFSVRIPSIDQRLGLWDHTLLLLKPVSGACDRQ